MKAGAGALLHFFSGGVTEEARRAEQQDKNQKTEGNGIPV